MWFLFDYLSVLIGIWTLKRSFCSCSVAATEPTLRDNANLREKSLVPMVIRVHDIWLDLKRCVLFLIWIGPGTVQSKVKLLLPIVIGDYTDFFSSMHHAKNCGTIFRGPENPIPPNWYRRFEVYGDIIQFPFVCLLDLIIFVGFQVSPSDCVSWTSVIYCNLWNGHYSTKVRICFSLFLCFWNLSLLPAMCS